VEQCGGVVCEVLLRACCRAATPPPSSILSPPSPSAVSPSSPPCDVSSGGDVDCRLVCVCVVGWCRVVCALLLWACWSAVSPAPALCRSNEHVMLLRVFAAGAAGDSGAPPVVFCFVY